MLESKVLLGDEVIATGLTFEEYLERFAGQHCEFVGGMVIKMSPAGKLHNDLIDYLLILLRTFFAFRPIGIVVHSPFSMRLETAPHGREPDLLVVLNANAHRLTSTFLDGPADICIEVISPESIDRDRGTKFREYEQGGVAEYWLIDHERQEARFYRLDENGYYRAHDADSNGHYETPQLPGLLLKMETLWQENFPTPPEIVAAVQNMLEV